MYLCIYITKYLCLIKINKKKNQQRVYIFANSDSKGIDLWVLLFRLRTSGLKSMKFSKTFFFLTPDFPTNFLNTAVSFMAISTTALFLLSSVI